MRYMLMVLIALIMTLPALAQNDAQSVAAAPLPASVQLEGVSLFWQDYNRCSAAAYSIQLSYFMESDYHENIKRLNPHIEDVSVRVEEMVEAAEEVGLKGIVRRGGTVETLKSLLAAGFPVLIENEYYEGANGWKDWTSHNRVAIGYDDATRDLLFYDSLLSTRESPIVRRKYEDIEARWRAFNHDYLVLYRPEEEEKLIATLGDMWDEQKNAAWVLERAEADIAGASRDSFALYNKAWALLQLGRTAEAVDFYDQARALGLPWRFFWYDFSALEAYLAVGRYETVKEIVRATLDGAQGIEELYYYIALAYEAEGETDRAIANLEAALFRNRFFSAAQKKLNDLKDS